MNILTILILTIFHFITFTHISLVIYDKQIRKLNFLKNDEESTLYLELQTICNILLLLYLIKWYFIIYLIIMLLEIIFIAWLFTDEQIIKITKKSWNIMDHTMFYWGLLLKLILLYYVCFLIFLIISFIL